MPLIDLNLISEEVVIERSMTLIKKTIPLFGMLSSTGIAVQL